MTAPDTHARRAADHPDFIDEIQRLKAGQERLNNSQVELRDTLLGHISAEDRKLDDLAKEFREGRAEHHSRIVYLEDNDGQTAAAIRELTVTVQVAIAEQRKMAEQQRIAAEEQRKLSEEQLKMAPMLGVYQDVTGAGRVIAWLIKHAKEIAVVGTCIWVGLNAPAVQKLLGL